ncbi:MAG: hypothetical protein HYT12_00285 [Candidatus Liptonbacteria bacterium]|nr:hypothetical protein [Candidatus Liptonbacteria bacterium]
MEDREIEILKRLEEQDKKLDAIFKSVEKTRRYFMWTFIVGLTITVLPLIGILILAPFLFGALSSAYTL